MEENNLLTQFTDIFEGNAQCDKRNTFETFKQIKSDQFYALNFFSKFDSKMMAKEVIHEQLTSNLKIYLKS